MTTAALAHGTWQELPAAPISGRSDAVGAWTGSLVLIWGGRDATSRGRPLLLGDGASYDPATRRWNQLPPSPLPPRASALSVWTGRQLLIWGGQGPTGNNYTDGAAFTPATRTWTALPSLPDPTGPTGPVRDRALVWTGTAAVLFTAGAEAPAATAASSVAAHRFVPGASSWTELPSLHLSAGHPAQRIAAVATDRQVWLWAQWSSSKVLERHEQGQPTSTATRDGTDVFTLDATTFRWRTSGTVPGGQGISPPWWTGTHILLPAGVYPRTYPGPRQTDLHGLTVDPTDGTSTAMPHGPVDDLRPTYVWTGQLLVAANSSDDRGGPPQTLTGHAAAWDPVTRIWTALHPAPASAPGGVVLWTGRQLFVWGQTSNTQLTTGSNPTATSGFVLQPAAQ
ncbi:hypothetical protein [Nakamurella endophytica]|uniref:hypothetical protein n=1 Tax=Nakamurella endophytica TaxID=1748367 RepID=UPI00166F1EBD|nr:hypothetical protein [Nakamurella endophytica]